MTTVTSTTALHLDLLEIHSMKYILLSFLLLPLIAESATVTVESMRVSEYADTEVSTNIPFEVSFDAMNRMSFLVSLDATPSNCVEVSVGTDANADGNLSPEEAGYTFGYNCGHWFVRDANKDEERGMGDETTTGRREKSFLLKRRNLSETWDMVNVTRRGNSTSNEICEVKGFHLGLAVMIK